MSRRGHRDRIISGSHEYEDYARTSDSDDYDESDEFVVRAATCVVVGDEFADKCDGQFVGVAGYAVVGEFVVVIVTGIEC
jgi:hypothetical protein